MLAQKDGAGVADTLQTALGHGEDANFIDRAKAVFDGAHQAEAAMGVALKVLHRIDHVLQHARAGQCAFFSHVTN